MKTYDTKIRSFLAISDIVSILNMSSGLMSIIQSINHNYELSALFMILAIVFDSVDGWVARKTNRHDELRFGKNIDSLSDVVSFGVAPAIFIYTLINHQTITLNILVTVISLFIVICGVLRLARYNVIADHITGNDFIGFPIPGISLILSTYYLTGFFNNYIALILSCIVSILMISNIKYPKFSNKPILAISCILIILLLLQIKLIMFNINLPALLILAFTLYYLIINLFKQ